MLVKPTLVSIVLSCAALSHASAPGFETAVTQAGLNYFKTVGVELLQKQLASLAIPDINGQTKTPIGEVSYSLSQIQLENTNLGNSAVGILPGTGLNVALSSIGADVTLNWYYRKNHWPHVSDHGSADISVSGASASVALQISEGSKGQPVVAVTKDSFSIGKLDIHLHGGASWLYDIFIDVFKGQIEHAVDNALTSAITKNIDVGLNAALGGLPLAVVVGKLAEIHYELTENPIFATGYASLPVSGAWSGAPPNEAMTCPSSACVVPPIPEHASSEMIQMIATDFVASSAGYVFWKLGKLQAQITDAMIPADFPVRLTTDSLKYLIPQLFAAFPNEDIVLELFPTATPQATFSTAGASIAVTGNLQVNVFNTSSPTKKVTAFTLSGTAKANGNADLSGLKVVPSVSFLAVDFNLTQSLIGKFNPQPLDSLLNTLLGKGVVPALNVLLAEGVPLPTVPGLMFIDPQLFWTARALIVSTNINYDPPSAA